jgi:glycerol uptake facilitator-like aquaporin
MGEVIATAGLIMIILIAVRRNQAALLVWLVPAWIGAAYFFTSSTSFANPAVTAGRMFSDTFAGISPASAPGFIVAQVVGAAGGAILAMIFAKRS